VTAPFFINTTIPAPNNYPGDDQPIMTINTANTVGFLKVDHVAPGAAGAGFHQQVTFASPPPVLPILPGNPGAIADPASIEYTNNGVAITTTPQLYWQNSQQVYPLSALKAFGLFSTVASGPATLLNSWNVATVTLTGTDPYGGGQYVVTLNTNAISTINALVNIYINATITVGGAFVNLGSTYTLTVSPGVLTIQPVTTIPPGKLVSFQIFQI
jgi:hypothetical protein